MNLLTPLALLLACEGKEPATELPTLAFLAPVEGATVAAGAVGVSVIVEHMTLAPPSATAGLAWPARGALALLPGGPAWAHNEGEPVGYVELRLDGVVVGQQSEIQGELADVAAGPHTLEGELLYSDGDPLDEPVLAEVHFTAE